VDRERATVEIRSFRAVFELERRLYRIDRLRLNPSGVPVRGVVFVVAFVLAVLVVQRLPVAGWPIRALPWQARYVALPASAGALLTMLRIDGRPAHVAVASIGRFVLSSRYLSAFSRCPRVGACWAPLPLTFIDDETPPMRFRGRGAVLIRGPHRLARRGRRLFLTLDRAPSDEGPRRVLTLRRGATLVVRARRR
jgi:hypothetical protein